MRSENNLAKLEVRLKMSLEHDKPEPAKFGKLWDRFIQSTPGEVQLPSSFQESTVTLKRESVSPLYYRTTSANNRTLPHKK